MSARPCAELDIECFHNWFLVGITDRATGTRWDYQMVPGMQLDLAALRVLLQHYTIVTFNGQGYDLPMVAYALTGADCAQLKAANDDIISTCAATISQYGVCRLICDKMSNPASTPNEPGMTSTRPPNLSKILPT